MKKTVVALAVSALAMASAAQAAPQENTFYAGARVGWSSFHDGMNHAQDMIGADKTKKNSVTYGVFGGYQIINLNNFGLAAELGYDNYGIAHWNVSNAKKAKFANHGVNFSLKPSYDLAGLTPALQGLDAYARVGVALIRSDYKGYASSGATDVRAHSLKVSPVMAAGLEYAMPFLPELAARLEYQWIHGVGKDNKLAANADFTPNIGSVTFGLSYRFGQGVAVVAPVVSETFSLSADVLFNSGKYNLKPAASVALDDVAMQVNQFGDSQVAVAGFADRMGKEAYNLKLSQHRAETVANYLISKGIQQDKVSATGYGTANPITGNSCDAVKGRKALIACLAPDRRVEIQVQGAKQVTL